MQHVLLTGGCGYKGSVLTAELLRSGYRVTVYDVMWFGNFLPEHEQLTVVSGDIRDIENVPMDGIDVVIHLANVANDPCSEIDASISWEVNTLASMRLIEKAIKHGARQFIYASSGSVYGVKDEPEVTEELSLVPISDYNKTKMVSERVLLSYSDQILTHIIRPATVCGYSPRMRLDVSVNLLTFLALKNGKITVLGGEQARPNIHIKDMTQVYMHFLKLGEQGQAAGVYNAGFENMKIIDLANMIAKTVPAEIVVTESNDPRSYRLNSDKLLSSGFEPKFGIIDGIKDVVDAYNNGLIDGGDRFYNVKTMVARLSS